MTIEQITNVLRAACAASNVVPYGTPVLNGTTWVVGFDPRDNTIALQAYYGDREIKTPEDERLIKHITEVEAAFPLYEIAIEGLLAEGNQVAVRGTFRGIHRGPFAGIDPTGKSVSAGLIVIYTLADGRIVDHSMQFDLLGLLQQLQGTSVGAGA